MAISESAPAPNAVDLHGLERLRHRAAADDPAALAEAAVQFEALFIGMMLDSARDARLGSGLLDGPQTEQYFALMDQQVALELARGGGFGFGKMLMQQLAERGDVAVPSEPARAQSVPRRPMASIGPAPPASGAASQAPAGSPSSLASLGGAASGTDGNVRADRFVARFLPEAEAAAAKLGIEPRLLLAQAALETGWGKSLERAETPANNLFGIKATPSWDGARTDHWTMEQGVAGLERRREEFRAYESSEASFGDYVNLIGSSPRYASAAASADDPEAYARAVSDAGYATDPQYADKWLSIYNGARLANALKGVAP